MKAILTIAGSDSSSGAGMQADCAAARSLGVLPLCAISCITSQNSQGLRMIQPAGLSIFTDQILAALEDINPSAVKIGMLPTSDHAYALLDIISSRKLTGVILDPILSSTLSCGAKCAPLWSNKELISAFAPHLTLLTPNIPEADAILGIRDTPLSIEEKAEMLISDLGINALLIKGGHSDHDRITDYLFTHSEGIHRFQHERITSPNTHGSGCALSSLIAAHIALGETLPEACRMSIESLHESMAGNAGIDFSPLRKNGKDPERMQGYGPAFFP